MAGGPNAAATGCWRCAERADRVGEGRETDWYVCRSCGFRFGIDFDACGPPDEPMWPLKPEQRAEIIKASAMWKKDSWVRGQ